MLRTPARPTLLTKQSEAQVQRMATRRSLRLAPALVALAEQESDTTNSKKEGFRNYVRYVNVGKTACGRSGNLQSQCNALVRSFYRKLVPFLGRVAARQRVRQAVTPGVAKMLKPSSIIESLQPKG